MSHTYTYGDIVVPNKNMTGSYNPSNGVIFLCVKGLFSTKTTDDRVLVSLFSFEDHMLEDVISHISNKESRSFLYDRFYYLSHYKFRFDYRKKVLIDDIRRMHKISYLNASYVNLDLNFSKINNMIELTTYIENALSRCYPNRERLKRDAFREFLNEVTPSGLLDVLKLPSFQQLPPQPFL